MIRWIVERSLKFQLFAVALAFILIIIGFIQLRNMPVDALPEFAPPFIEIQTEAQGLSTPEVEELVTFNLEELLNGTPWLQSIRSTSVPGLSTVILTFQPGTDILRARQLVSERLSLAYALPNVAQSPVILQPQSAMSRVMMAGLYSKQISPIDMSILAYWNIRPALLSVPGVANVAIWGLRYKQLAVEADPRVLKAKNVTLDQIISTTGNALWVSPLSFLNASTPGSGGWIDTPQQRIEVRHVMPISTAKDLAQINIEDTKLNLGDVTTISSGFPPLIGDDVVNDGSGLLVLIDKFPGVNTLDVTRKIEAKLEELKPGLGGINIDKSIFRPASFVETLIGNISIALAIGFLLLTLTLLILMRSFRAVLICLITIAVSFALAITILSLCGMTINIMVLAGLMMAVAIITDEVIIDVEKLFLMKSREKITKTSDLSNFLLTAALNNRSNMFYATLIILLALLPIFFLNGIAGAFFQPLAIAYAVSIIVTMVVAWYITPALCVLLLPKKERPSQKSSIVNFGERYYQSSLTWLCHNVSNSMLAICTITLAILTFVALILFISFKNPPLVPGFKERDILVQWEGPPGTSVEEMVRISTLVSRELRSLPGVHNVAVEIGRAVLGDKIVNVNSAQLTINIKQDANYQATVSAIKKVVAGYPGIFHLTQTYLKERTQEILTGTPYDIVVRIFGHDFLDLHNKALEIKQALSHIKGAKNINLTEQVEQPEIAIEVNLAKATQYGLKPGDVRRTAATLVASLQAGSLFDEQKIFPVVVWGIPELRKSISGMRNILIDTPSGHWVRLDEVADISIKPSPNFIQHDTVSRSTDIGINVAHRSANAIVNEIKEKLKVIRFPLEYRAEVLGIYQQKLITKERLLISGLAVALLIFLLLQAIFESFILAFLIFFTLPLALIGSVFTAWIIGSTSSIALTGLFAVFAVAIRNTLMSITYYQAALRKEDFKEDLLFTNARIRLTPIILTACGVIVTILPFIFMFNEPGLEIVGPIAAIIVGGIITTTIYTGFIVPALYLGFRNRENLAASETLI